MRSPRSKKPASRRPHHDLGACLGVGHEHARDQRDAGHERDARRRRGRRRRAIMPASTAMSTSRSRVESRKAPKVEAVPLWRATAPSTRSKKPARDHQPAARARGGPARNADAAPTDTSGAEHREQRSGSGGARRGTGRPLHHLVEPVPELLLDHGSTWEQPFARKELGTPRGSPAGAGAGGAGSAFLSVTSGSAARARGQLLRRRPSRGGSPGGGRASGRAARRRSIGRPPAEGRGSAAGARTVAPGSGRDRVASAATRTRWTMATTVGEGGDRV